MKARQFVALTVALLALPVGAEGPNDKPAIKHNVPESYFSPPPPFPDRTLSSSPDAERPKNQPTETDVAGIQPETGTAGASTWNYNVAVKAKDFMLSAAHPLAVQAGYKVLKAGGTAMDAAVAVQLVLNVVEPQSSGLGGGAFLLYWDAEKKELITYDGRETAPAYVTPDHFLDAEAKPLKFFAAVAGGKSVGVPGTLRLLETAHINHGKRPWSDLVLPAIEIAHNGFEVTPRLAESIKGAAARGLKDFHRAREYFFDAQGEPLKAGSRLKNIAFAELLQKIRTHGADVLYIGQYAQDMVTAVNESSINPGNITLQDLQDYAVKIREPVCAPYREYKICGMGPPSSGALTVGQILGVLQHFDMAGLSYGVDAVHFFLEAAKLAYADRGRYMADEDFVNMPTQGLLDPAYLTTRAQLIKFNQSMEKAEPGNPPWINSISLADDESIDRPGTTHFSIIDKYGNIVSMTSTIETGFGSRLMVHGFLLNNELTDFSFRSEQEGRLIANRIEAGKRPRSSMAPTIVFDAQDKPILIIGSPGGSRIINYVAKVIVSVLDWKFDVQSAINMGHFANRNGVTDIEPSSSSTPFAAKLTARGHTIKLRDLNSGLHGIQIKQDGTLIGGADPRREGIVMGD